MKMQQVLICNDGLSSKMNKVKELVVHAICSKQALKMAHHFDYHSSWLKEVPLQSSWDPHQARMIGIYDWHVPG